ncbi:unnamed protein product [Thelazia callipaeda]|uniref:Mobile element protein n=1 Tax=Thelazia callipaeda TaxID=103827 RepID=A0A0N5CTT9_THECL|nr:unnamed protein product [Thelazia callipaeda]
MEGLDRIHIITDDSEVQIIDDQKEKKKKLLMDSLTWPHFIETVRKEKEESVKQASFLAN